MIATRSKIVFVLAPTWGEVLDRREIRVFCQPETPIWIAQHKVGKGVNSLGRVTTVISLGSAKVIKVLTWSENEVDGSHVNYEFSPVQTIESMISKGVFGAPNLNTGDVIGCTN